MGEIKQQQMKTGMQEYLEEGKIYRATPEDVCIVCNEKIDTQEYVTSLRSNWDKKGSLDFDRDVTDELKGYKHFSCLK